VYVHLIWWQQNKLELDYEANALTTRPRAGTNASHQARSQLEIFMGMQEQITEGQNFFVYSAWWEWRNKMFVPVLCWYNTYNNK